MDELAFLSATEQAALVRRGEVSPLELVELSLARIERLDPALNAFVTVCGDEARAAARSELPDGPFRGVTLPIKDLDETAGVRTTYSSRAYADNVPDFDRAAVRRLKAAGFVVIGKTNTPELGSTAVTESVLNGVCRNPWDTSRTPGGSSGGAAAAIAAGLAPAAHGSDGGGSIRIPASCCGLVGLKPSRGRVSPAPYGGGEGLATSGAITRTVLDTAALLDVLAGPEVGDVYAAPPPERPFAEEVGREPGRLRVALTSTPAFEAEVDGECRAAAAEAGRLLEGLGHHVEEATPPWRAPELLLVFRRVWQVPPALMSRGLDLLEPLNRGLAEEAARTTSVDYVRAVVSMRDYARRVLAFWEGYDLVLTPTLATPPVPVGTILVGDWEEQFERGARFTPFTPVANVTGQPAISLPLAWSADGLPIGVQLFGRPGGEATLIRVAAQLEAERPWRDRRPPVS